MVSRRVCCLRITLKEGGLNKRDGGETDAERVQDVILRTGHTSLPPKCSEIPSATQGTELSPVSLRFNDALFECCGIPC